MMEEMMTSESVKDKTIDARTKDPYNGKTVDEKTAAAFCCNAGDREMKIKRNASPKDRSIRVMRLRRMRVRVREHKQ